MNPILRALGAGYTSSKILRYLRNVSPELASKVSVAMQAGYSADAILRFITRSGKKLHKELPEATKEPFNVAKAQAFGIPKEAKTAGKFALGAAGLAAAAPMLSRMAGSATGIADRLTDRIGGPPQLPGGPPQPSPIGPVPGPMGPVPGQQPSPPPTQAPIASGAPTPNTVEMMGMKDTVTNLVNIGNQPEQIAAVIKTIIRPGQRKWLEDHIKKGGMTVEDAVEQIASQISQQPQDMVREQSPIQQVQEPTIAPTQEQMVPEAQVVSEQKEMVEEPDISDIERDEKESMPLKEGSRVFLPSGSEGSIVSIKGDTAVVQVGDRKRKVPLNELSDVSEEFLKSVDDMIAGIPESERSAAVAWGSFVPSMTVGETTLPVMAIQYHDGSMYLYPEATQDDFDSIFGKAYSAKTTGENAWRAWTTGEASRGAGKHVITKRLEERFGKNYIRFSPEFDMMKKVRHAAKILEKRRKKR